MDHPHRIVVIDDEQALRHGFVRILQQAGYEVVGASSWTEGEQQIRAYAPELILLDVVLPDADGIKQCRALKARPEFANTSVVLLSGTRIESDSQAEGLESGADGYIAKPIAPREFLARVQAILRLKETETRLAQALQELASKNAALRKSEEIARALLNATSDIAVLLAPDGTILEANHALAAQCGCAEHDLLGQNIYSLFPSDVAEARQTIMQRVLETRRPVRHEDADRGIITANSVYPIIDAQGRVERVAVFAQDITARKHAENQLRRLSAAVEQSPNILVITNPEGRIEYVNPQFTEVTGYAAEEALGQYPGILKSGLVSRAVYADLWQTIRQGRIWRGEWQNRTKDGDLYWESASISAIRNQQGDITHFLKVAQDISDRKQAEKALQGSGAKLRTIVEHANVGIVLDTPEGRIQSCNPAFAAMLGYAPEELIGRHFREFTHPDDREAETDMFNAMLGGASENYQVEKRYITKQGQIIWVQVKVACLRDQHGAVENLIVIIDDITERKHTQVELEISAERFRSVIETVGEGITLSNETGYFEIFNSKMEDLTGYTRDEANHAQNFLACLYPDPRDYEQALRGIQDLRRGTGTRDLETTIRARTGARKTLLVSTAILWRQEHPWFLSAYHDITDRKRAEQELAQAKEMAEDARKSAELANQAKSEFLANMSHELRTPLNGVLGYAQILKRDPDLTEKQREGLDIIQRSGDHLLTLLNDILDLSRIEAGKLDLQSAPFHLDHAIHTIVEVMRLRAQQKGLTFTVTVAPEVPREIRGDEKCLRQVLLNLLGNAVKFTTQGRIALTIENLHPRAPIANLRFTITDTGIGIPAEQREHIFSPFEQVKNRRIYAEGTGLGLAISRRLVRMMGSELYVDSQVDQGSRFWFDVVMPVSEPSEPDMVGQAKTISGFQGQPRRLLVADDKVENRQVLKDMLEPLGFEVHEAVNGQQTLRKVWELRPDVVLLDIFMPIVTGLDVTRTLRQSAELQDLVIIAVSASVFEHIRQQCLEAGCDDFLPKPIVQAQLFEVLARHTDIHWISGADAWPDEAPDDAPDDEDRPLPPYAWLQELDDLAMIGDIMGIRNLVREFEALRPEFHILFQRLAALAGNLKVNELQQAIRRALERAQTAPETHEPDVRPAGDA